VVKLPGARMTSECLLLAHSCPGRMRRHVRSWRKLTRIPSAIRW
jgi:hypothetical protein